MAFYPSLKLIKVQSIIFLLTIPSVVILATAIPALATPAFAILAVLILASIGNSIMKRFHVDERKKHYNMKVSFDEHSYEKWKIQRLPGNNNFPTQYKTVAFIGSPRMGKTFHINHLFNLKLPVNQYCNHYGLSIVVPEMKISETNVIAIEYAGQGLFSEKDDVFDIDKKLYDVERFHLKVAVALSDVLVICIERLSLSSNDFVKQMQETIQNMNQLGNKKLILLHNYKDIESAELALSTFEKYVVETLNARKQKEGYWISQYKDVNFPIYHLIIGRENCPSGRKYNSQSYNNLKNLIACTKNETLGRQFEEELLNAMNYNINEFSNIYNKRFIMNGENIEIIVE
jgi:hypothetical protein